MTEVKLGKISHISFGWGGYQGVMFGITLRFDLAGGSSIGDFRGQWGMEPSKDAKWTRESRRAEWGVMVEEIMGWCTDAKVNTLADLKGIPVEVTIMNDRFHSFRILKEVL